MQGASSVCSQYSTNLSLSNMWTPLQVKGRPLKASSYAQTLTFLFQYSKSYGLIFFIHSSFFQVYTLPLILDLRVWRVRSHFRLANVVTFLRYGKKSQVWKKTQRYWVFWFSALGAYLLLISKGTALSRNGALLRNTALFNFQEKKILRKNLWCLFEKDQEHWWTNMLSLDLSWSERTATKSSSQNLKARSFV